MKPRRYIGVTGITNAVEAQAVIAGWKWAWKGETPPCDLMLGVLMSDKTLAGRQNKWPRRYPMVGDVADIIDACAQPGVLPLVHYAGDKSLRNLVALRHAAGPLCAGFQWNGEWPERRALAEAFGPSSPLRFVFQARDFFAPPSLPSRLDAYRFHATDVLLDTSGGKGIPFDGELVRGAVELLACEMNGLGIGFAGGLDGWLLKGNRVAHALIHAGYSADAEGRLRDDAEGGGNLTIDKVCDYFDASVRAIKVAP